MIVLGIESSCDETAASIVEFNQAPAVRSSVVATQHDLHAEYGGVVPEIASRAHAERMLPVVRAAVSEAGLSMSDLDAIAVGHRPGLVGSLLVGVSAAKALSWSLGVPLVGVDHVQAHLYASALDQDPIDYPSLGLVISGGHSSIYAMQSATRTERIGATIDDAVGEAFDKVAAMLGLGHPGGPQVERLAADGNDHAFDFPISRLSPSSLDFSFSGLKTAVLYEIKGRPPARKLAGKPPRPPQVVPPMTPSRSADIAASFQRAAVAAILLKLTRSIDHVQPVKSLVVGGGVAANQTIRQALQEFADTHGIQLRIAPMKFCVDNAAMIAGLGACRLQSGDDFEPSEFGLSLTALPTSAS